MRHHPLRPQPARPLDRHAHCLVADQMPERMAAVENDGRILVGHHFTHLLQ